MAEWDDDVPLVVAAHVEAPTAVEEETILTPETPTTSVEPTTSTTTPNPVHPHTSPDVTRTLQLIDSIHAKIKVHDTETLEFDAAVQELYRAPRMCDWTTALDHYLPAGLKDPLELVHASLNPCNEECHGHPSCVPKAARRPI